MPAGAHATAAGARTLFQRYEWIPMFEMYTHREKGQGSILMYILVLELLSHKQLSQSFLIPVTRDSRLPWTVIIVYPSFLVGQCCTEGAKGSHRPQKFVPNVSGQSFSPRKSSMQLL